MSDGQINLDRTALPPAPFFPQGKIRDSWFLRKGVERKGSGKAKRGSEKLSNETVSRTSSNGKNSKTIFRPTIVDDKVAVKFREFHLASLKENALDSNYDFLTIQFQIEIDNNDDQLLEVTVDLDWDTFGELENACKEGQSVNFFVHSGKDAQVDLYELVQRMENEQEEGQENQEEEKKKEVEQQETEETSSGSVSTTTTTSTSTSTTTSTTTSSSSSTTTSSSSLSKKPKKKKNPWELPTEDDLPNLELDRFQARLSQKPEGGLRGDVKDVSSEAPQESWNRFRERTNTNSER